MKGTVLYGARDIRFEEVAAPKIAQPTDAIVRLSATCVCGSDLWPYRGIQPIAQPTPMGHEYCRSEVAAPKIAQPTDAIVRLSATCVCGSDLWPYRGIQPIAQPTPMGHEYC